MKPPRFDYHRPASVSEAAEMLAASDGKVLAGGQSLVPLMSMRIAAPAALVDINHIEGLATVDISDSAVTIGALTRHAQLEHHDAAFDANPLLRRALGNVAHATIRNRGTTLGSIVHADPASEMPAVLALLDGSVDVVSSARGERTIDAADLFVGPLESSLADDEVAVAARFPHPAPGSGSSWCELSRRRGDYALVGVGALVSAREGVVTRAQLALISVGLTPVVVDVSATCSGAAYDDVDWSGATDLVVASIDPDGDIHATAAYRSHLARVLSQRALDQALADADGGRAA